MFWSKRRSSLQPPTPKMAPVSLPFDHAHPPQWHRVPLMPTHVLHERQTNIHPAPSKYRHDLADRRNSGMASGWYSDVERKPKITAMPSDVLPGRGSRTPHPALSKPSYDLAQAQAHRTRKPSISNGAIDEVLKPLKGILKPRKASVDDDEIVKPVKSVVTEPLYDRGGPYKLDQTDDCLKPPKSILKGGGHSHNVTTVHSVEKTSSYAGHPGSYVPLSYEKAPNYRPRNHSFTGQEARVSRTLPLDKYSVKTHVVRVVQKEESIALSWPLTTGASSGRRRYPLIYFDIWFNPQYDPSAVKAYVNGHFQNFADGDRNLPASSHCILNEMDVTCPVLQTSFTIRIRRPDGIRCIDVFQEIFNAYDHRLSKEEQRILASEIDDRCITAFKKRCRDAPHLPLVNERQGMRRVDLLRGKRIFNGLTRDPHSQTWLLEFHRPGE